MVNEINSQKSTWKAAYYNKWDNYTFGELYQNMGVSDDYNHSKALKRNHIIGDLPDSFNASVQWPKCTSIGQIRDEAQCSSSWAFAMAESATDRWCIAKNQTENPPLSMEQVLACCGSACGYGCQGGFPLQAWQYWVNNGLVTGNFYGQLQYCQPYFLYPCGLDCPKFPANTPKCLKSCDPGYNGTVPYEDDFRYGQSAYTVDPDQNQIKQEIYTYGPVEATMVVYEDFLNYRFGVYRHITGTSMGVRAVKILGWGSDQAGGDYWICANSWNTKWGQNGFFLIARGVNECGIETGVTAGQAKV